MTDARERPRPRRRGAGLGFRRIGADASGASALEFALLAGPLIFLLLAIVQMTFVFASNYSLETAVNRAARLVRTGQAQTADAAEFKSQVCEKLSIPLTCDKLMLDVRPYDNFAGAAGGLTQPLNEDDELKPSFSYNPGVRGDVMVVRAFYPLDIGAFLPSEISLSNMAGNQRLLVATAAFRNEPF